MFRLNNMFTRGKAKSITVFFCSKVGKENFRMKFRRNTLSPVCYLDNSMVITLEELYENFVTATTGLSCVNNQVRNDPVNIYLVKWKVWDITINFRSSAT